MRLVVASHLVNLCIGLLSVACSMPISASNASESRATAGVFVQHRGLTPNCTEPQMPHPKPHTINPQSPTLEAPLIVSFLSGKSDGKDERELGELWKARDVVRSFLNQPKTRGGRPAGTLFELSVDDIHWANQYKASGHLKHGIHISVENEQDKEVCNPKCTFILLKPHSHWKYGEYVDGTAFEVSGFTDDHDIL